jgi:hypothetical protein
MKTFKQFFENHEWEASANPEVRARDIKQLIDNGEMPDVYVAGFTRNKYCFGDLVRIGYAIKRAERRSRTSTSEWWEYTGPTRIAAISTHTAPGPDGVYRHKEVRTYMKNGDETPEVEVDYG